MGTTLFKKYERTNLSFEEVFDGEYALPLKEPPATVLDIGANEGAFTAWAAEKWPNAKVFAYEPIPENAALFRRNFPQVELFEAAVSTINPAKLYYGKQNSGQCSMLRNGEQIDKTVEVRSINPSELPSCEFVKVDTEGAEIDIIPRLNLSKTKAIVFEYHNWEETEQIIVGLEHAGFEAVEHVAHCTNRGVLKYARPGAFIKEPDEEQKPIKVYIGVPSYFYIDPHFHRCLLMAFGWLASQPDKPGSIHGEVAHSFGDSPNVGRSRNMITRNFLESDCTDLLFIDSDIVFSIDHLKRILSHKEEVVGGMYFKKGQGKAEACLNTIHNPIVKSNGLNQVNYIGTGFLRIKRIVFEKIIERWGDEIAYCPDGSLDLMEYNFWNLAMHTFDNEMIEATPARIAMLVNKYHITPEQADKAIRTRWLSEDWWFCQRCNDLGFKVWADRRIALKHSGNILYPLLTQEQEIFGKRNIYGSSKDPGSAGASLGVPTLAASA
jgi:FkbM family methyltransferase